MIIRTDLSIRLHDYVLYGVSNKCLLNGTMLMVANVLHMKRLINKLIKIPQSGIVHIQH